MDALTGQDLSRWFPLTSPSDFLYFLPPRRGVDTAKRLRLISSAAGMGSPLESLGNFLHGFSTTLFGSGSTSVVSFLGTNYGRSTGHDAHSVSMRVQEVSGDGFMRRISATSVDHYRAVPLSDGYHILFTDPRSGNLCLGTDAPVGALTRLLRKVWFPPPPEAASPVPMLYAAGSDVRHGVRVVATFAAKDDIISGRRDSGRAEGVYSTDEPIVTDTQIVVFYTIPPDMFHDISHAGLTMPPNGEHEEHDDRSSE